MERTLKFTTVFGYPFRPFFALFALQGLLIIPYWTLAWLGHLPLPSITANPLLWHGHEMLFGFTSAAIAGFLLTAVANWTKRPPISGIPLLFLCVLWLLARLTWCLPNPSVLPIAAAFDVGFDILLLVLFTYELFAADNHRNLKVAAVLFLYTAVNAGMYFALLNEISDPVKWLRAAMYLVIFLITIIGGRVIPLFTGNWLRQNLPACKQPPMFNSIDRAVVVITAVFMLTALAALPMAGAMGIVAGLAQILRLMRWQGWNTTPEPLLWSLHLGYAWLGIGLLLNGVALFGAIPTSAGMHALTVGAISGLILAMSSRAALGHTGRALTSHPLLTSAFILINIAALTRVLAALIPDMTALLLVSALAWVTAFGAYCVRYFPILFFPNERSVQGDK